MKRARSLGATLAFGLLVGGCHHKVTMPRDEPATPSPGAHVTIPACASRAAPSAHDALEGFTGPTLVRTAAQGRMERATIGADPESAEGQEEHSAGSQQLR